MSPSAADLRSCILDCQDLPRQKVYVPEWSAHVWVRMLTVEERGEFEARHIVEKIRGVRERLIVATACDESGKSIFTDKDIPALAKKCAKAADRLFGAAMKHNGIMSEDVDTLKKNSETTTPAGSLSS